MAGLYDERRGDGCSRCSFFSVMRIARRAQTVEYEPVPGQKRGIMERRKTTWLDLMRLADDADEAIYEILSREAIQASVLTDGIWFEAITRLPLTELIDRWRTDEEGYAYREREYGPDYPRLHYASFAGEFRVAALRMPLLRAIRSAPDSPVMQQYEVVEETYRHSCTIDSSIVEELDEEMAQWINELARLQIPPEDEEQLMWKFYRRYTDSETYADLTDESERRRTAAAQLDRPTFIADLELRGFRARDKALVNGEPDGF